jgi:hypothetical protein
MFHNISQHFETMDSTFLATQTDDDANRRRTGGQRPRDGSDARMVRGTWEIGGCRTAVRTVAVAKRVQGEEEMGGI